MPHPTRPCRCAVGRHADAADIDARLRTGDSLNQILVRYPTGFSRSSLNDHSRKCLGLGGAPRTGVQPSVVVSVVQPPDGRRRPGAQPPPGCPTKEQRIVHIINLMARLEWVTGVTSPELAELWGCNPGTVEHDACEASRAVQRQVDPGAVQATVMAALHEALELGLDFARTKVIDGRTREGDPKALNALANIAKAMQVFAPTPRAVPTGPTAEQRPVLHVHYPEGMAPALSDGPALQSPAGQSPPGPRSWP
jgi:hypothetical protein